jgi:hypothetical protein
VRGLTPYWSAAHRAEWFLNGLEEKIAKEKGIAETQHIMTVDP